MRFRNQSARLIADTSTPVLVLDSPHHGGLAVTRSLGRLGIPVVNVHASGRAPALFSRYCQRKFIWDLDSAPPEKSLKFLQDIAGQVGRQCLLLPTTDSAAIFAAAYAGQLREWYIFPEQSPAIVPALCSKKDMYHLARRLHIAVPSTICPQTKADLLSSPDVMGFPLIIKGVEGQSRVPQSKTKLVLRTLRELRELADQIGESTVPHLLVQEYISGEGAVWMFNGYFDARSECLLGFTGRKLRECPIFTGVTSLGLCWKNETVEEVAKKFMRAIGYRGVLDMDFCYDARDGRYKVLDVNPRIGSTFRLFASPGGLDVARAMYLDLTGQPLSSEPAPDGRKWIVEDFDLVASFRYYREGRLTVRQWLRSLRGIQESAFLAFDDPLPMLLMLRADIGELRRLFQPRTQLVPPFEYKRQTAAACPPAPAAQEDSKQDASSSRNAVA